MKKKYFIEYTSRVNWVIFGIILVFGVFQKIYKLGDRGLWYDELFLVLSASSASL